MDSIIVFCAKYLFVAVIACWAVAWLQAAPKLRLQMIWATLAALIVAAILDKVSGKLYYDPRPFVSQRVHPLFAHAADNGFPSDHTLFSAALAATLFFYRPRLGMLAFALALIVGAARVAAHVHSPIDIIGGAIIGAISGWIGYTIGARLTKPSRRQKAEAAAPKER